MSANPIQAQQPRFRVTRGARQAVRRQSVLFEIVRETADAHERNEIARHVDARGDLVADKLCAMTRMVRRARSPEEAHHLASIMGDLLTEWLALDEIEDEHRDANDEHCLKANRHGLDGIQITEAEIKRAQLRALEGRRDGYEADL